MKKLGERHTWFVRLRGAYTNKAQCRICNDIIESKHRHDWVACKGGHIFVDGGKDYRRCGTLKEGVVMEDIIWIKEGLKNDVIEVKKENEI